MQFGLEVARGLNWLHHKGIIHRDLKPSNVLIDRHGCCKIADFGLAIVRRRKRYTTLTGGFYSRAGTPCYMAPEVLKGEPYGSPADVYAFGVMLCAMLLGHYPYQGPTGSEDDDMGQLQLQLDIIRGTRPHLPGQANTHPSSSFTHLTSSNLLMSRTQLIYIYIYDTFGWVVTGGLKESVRTLIENCWQGEPWQRPCFDQVHYLIMQTSHPIYVYISVYIHAIIS